MPGQPNGIFHALVDELKRAGHFLDRDDSALGGLVGHFMKLTAKPAGPRQQLLAAGVSNPA